MISPKLVQVSCMKAYTSTHCRPTFFSVSASENEKMIHEWDGLTRYLDSVMSRFFKVENYEVSRHRSASYKLREMKRDKLQRCHDLQVLCKVSDPLPSLFHEARIGIKVFLECYTSLPNTFYFFLVHVHIQINIYTYF